MVKTYSIEEIDNINLGRHAIFGQEYEDVRGYKYIGVEENRLKKLLSASETTIITSLLSPGITNVQQAITNIYNILSAGTGVNTVGVTAPITLGGTATNPIIGYKAETEDGIIAHAGGLQALARPLTKKYNFVDTVASAGDSLLLLPATIGLEQFVRNFGANSMNVFPWPLAKHYGKLVNVPQAITPGNGRWFVCSTINEYRVI
jgi:hypothetical protein